MGGNKGQAKIFGKIIPELINMKAKLNCDGYEKGTSL